MGDSNHILPQRTRETDPPLGVAVIGVRADCVHFSRDEGVPQYGGCSKGILYIADLFFDKDVDEQADTVLIDEYGDLTAFRFLVNEHFGCNRFIHK